MLKRHFDPTKPHRYVKYLRMSDKKQNERSPDQQNDEIERVKQRMNLPWKEVGVFRDDGRKGAYIRKRKAFSRMLNEIRSGRLKVDVIAVDTTERFARSDEMPTIRKELYEKYGVLVVTAESGFADPLTPQGKVYALVEGIRSTEENRIKAHQILRSKRDLVSRKLWPGGPVPDGLKLKKVIEEVDGVEVVRGSVIFPDDAFRRFIRIAFVRTKETGEGPSKVAIFIKQHPDFPPDKDLSGSTVTYWLKNKLYKGVMVYAANCTGIVDDVRKVEPNDPDDIQVVEDYCEPIVEPALWDAVAVIRNARKRKPTLDADDEKLIKPIAGGFTISHMLSGLARCGCCGSSMRPSTSSRKSKGGKTYTYYSCPRKHDGGCENVSGIREDWLREQVVGHLTESLLSSDSDVQTDSLAELKKRVRRYVSQRKEANDDPRPQLEAAIAEINTKSSGWVQSLANPNLPPEVRLQIETQMTAEAKRKLKLEQSLLDANQLEKFDAFQIDDADIDNRLDRLGTVLGNANPTLAHLELSLHIDRIDCFRDGTVEARFCILGVGGLDLIDTIASFEGRLNDPVQSAQKCKPRRRARLHAVSESHESTELDSLSFWATDPYRFAELGDNWFELVRFNVPEPTFWAKENAVQVSEKRLEGLTHEKLAEHFGVTVPTIRKALKIGQELDPKFKAAPKKMARARWHEDNAKLVFETSKSMMMKDMVVHFGKSDVTLRKALVHAKNVLGLS